MNFAPTLLLSACVGFLMMWIHQTFWLKNPLQDTYSYLMFSVACLLIRQYFLKMEEAKKEDQKQASKPKQKGSK